MIMDLRTTRWLLVLMLLPLTARTDSVLVDGVAARVNESTITVGDVLLHVQPVRQQLHQKYRGDELAARLKKAYKESLDTLIERRLLLDAYKEKGSDIPEWAVDERIDEIVRDVFRGDRSALMKALSKDQTTLEDWRGQVRDQIVLSAVRQANVEQHVSISPRAILETYKSNLDRYKELGKVKLRMIVLKKAESGGEAPGTRSRAEEIRKRLKAGENFGALARRLSEGSKAEDGGDWGWIEPGLLRGELARAAAALRPGEMSEVIETARELYILLVEGRKSEAVTPFEEVRPQIERELRRKESEAMYRALVDRLRQKAYIEILDVDVF